MVERYVLKLVDKIPLKLCKPITERKYHGSVLDTLEDAV
nr:MAG TPA: hypothetical protein [Caudoviricetes sp.]